MLARRDCQWRGAAKLKEIVRPPVRRVRALLGERELLAGQVGMIIARTATAAPSRRLKWAGARQAKELIDASVSDIHALKPHFMIIQR